MIYMSHKTRNVKAEKGVLQQNIIEKEEAWVKVHRKMHHFIQNIMAHCILKFKPRTGGDVDTELNWSKAKLPWKILFITQTRVQNIKLGYNLR